MGYWVGIVRIIINLKYEKMNNEKIMQIFSSESNQWVDCDQYEYDCADDDKKRIVNEDGNKIFVTEIIALEASTGELKNWCGDHVYAETFEEAQKWCNENKGYLKVVGKLG